MDSTSAGFRCNMCGVVTPVGLTHSCTAYAGNMARVNITIWSEVAIRQIAREVMREELERLQLGKSEGRI